MKADDRAEKRRRWRKMWPDIFLLRFGFSLFILFVKSLKIKGKYIYKQENHRVRKLYSAFVQTFSFSLLLKNCKFKLFLLLKSKTKFALTNCVHSSCAFWNVLPSSSVMFLEFYTVRVHYAKKRHIFFYIFSFLFALNT